MMFEKAYSNDKQFLALTSLLPNEFDLLFTAFEPRWLKWYKHYDFRMKRRQKPLSARQLSRPTKTLATNKLKLFFVLYLYKVNPLQEAAALTFEMNQGQVSRWRKVLTPIVLHCLEDLDFQAARDAGQLIHLFRNRQNKRQDTQRSESLHLDATERPIERNLDYNTQKCDYSGKQHDHTVKNSVVCDEFQFIHFLGDTWRTTVSDATIITQEIPKLTAPCFDQLWLSKDAGYQGYRPNGVHLLEQSKGFRANPLNTIQKEMNSWISSIRVVVENAINGMKRLRATKDRLRGFCLKKADQIIALAAGLHNLRVHCRINSYTLDTPCVRANLNPFDT
ncbi:MAG: transposase family protein [Bacteroidota bacterium]